MGDVACQIQELSRVMESARTDEHVAGSAFEGEGPEPSHGIPRRGTQKYKSAAFSGGPSPDIHREKNEYAGALKMVIRTAKGQYPRA